MSIIRDGFQSADLDVPVVLPTLNLDFANSQELDPRITFSRGSIGTFVNKNGLIETAPANQPRFDYDPISGECRGLLIEESRVNGIRNNTMVGAVVGAPGTVPTNWSWGASQSGVVREIIATGVEDGISYIDVRFSGKATGNPTTFYSFSAESSVGNFPGTNTSRYTSSAYFKLISGIIPSGVVFIMVFNAQDASFVNLNEYRTLAINLPSTSNKRLIENRFAFTNTDFVSTSTAYIRPYYQVNVPFNTYVDFTIRVGMPQVESGSFATSIIPTSGSTVTRSADNVSMIGSNFTSVFGSGTPSELSVFYSGLAPYVSNNGGYYWLLTNASTTERIQYRYAGQPQVLVYLNNSSAGYVGVYASATQDRNIRSVGLIDNKSIAIRSNDSSPSYGPANATIPRIPTGFTQLNIGSSPFGSNYLNGTIRKLAFYPKRLTNSQAVYLTQ